MAQFKGVLLDLGGVVYVGETPLPGAIAAVQRLRDAGIGVRFVTNTTRTPHRKLCAQLRRMGVPFTPEELFTPARAACQLLEKKDIAPHLLVHPALKQDFARLKTRGEGGRAVIVGDAGDAFTYPALNAAFRALTQGAQFIALANNRSFRDADGGLSLDAGPFVAALGFASRREAMVLGKPAPGFFMSAVESLGCEAQETAMIGDDVESDVAGAMAAGISGILVRTGKYAPGDEARIDPAPSFVGSDLSAAVEWVLAG